MSKKIQLQISKPCHEDWDNMTPVEKGRFCSSCQKQVVDFSNMSDREVAMFFKKPSTGSVCGRFMTDQLYRDLEIPRKRIPWVKYFFQFILPGFLITTKATAQGNIRVKTKSVCSKSLTKKEQGKLVFDNNEKMIFRTLGLVGIRTVDVEPRYISGKIIDDKGQPIPYVTIMIKDGRRGTISDELGNYQLMPEENWKELVLEFTSTGHEIKLVAVQRKNYLGNLDVVLPEIKTFVFGYTTPSRPKKREVAIAGKISNENHQPIPFATVAIDGVITVADSFGNYKARVSTLNPRIQIKASSAGYFSKEIHKEATQSTIHQDLMLKANDVLNEVVVVSYKPSETRKVTTTGLVVKQSAKSNHVNCNVTLGEVTSGVRIVNETNNDVSKKITSTEMKLYPNPIQAHSTLHIAWDQKETGDFDMQFFNSAGQLVFKKQLYIDEDARVLSVDLPSLVAGNYFVKMINRSTSKSYTAKIIVQ